MALIQVAGVVTAPRDYNLHVLSVSRQMSDDYQETAVDVEFTASYEPEVEWTHSGGYGETVVIPGKKSACRPGRKYNLGNKLQSR